MTGADDATPTRSRRTDPGRRDRIIDSCLDVIATAGVAGTSHRKVATAADVPLGSMTYHFAGMDELLHAAFTRFADQIADRFERRMSAATTVDEARDAVVALMSHDVFADARDLALSLELYTLAAREPVYRTITQHWMQRSRTALQRHFPPITAQQLDALIEGVSIHAALSTEPQDRALVVDAVRRITADAGG